MTNSYYTLKTGENNQYYFNLKAGNHEIILQSEGYTNKSNAINGIESVQKNSQDKNNFESRASKKNEPYFVLKAQNGEIIGVSEMYSSIQAMQNGIESVYNNGSTTVVKDLTFPNQTTIIVNGREKKWNNDQISFKEIIEIAFDNYSESPNTCYTVTYSRGVISKPEGSMIKDQKINVKSKMIFNVTATDKS